MLPTLLATALSVAASVVKEAGAQQAARDSEARPFARNLILISLDTLRADRLGCYGYDRPTSPAIDALAARGFALPTSSPSPRGRSPRI